jgi:hypothetical protein
MDARTINELFVSKLASTEGREKVAAEGTNFIRTKLREVSFARKIIPPHYVSKADLTRSVNHDQFVKIVDKEPDSKAMTVNFRGDPTVNYLEGPRYEIPLFHIYSEEFQKVEEELLAYEMPITEVIERNSVLDIQKIEDESFIRKIDQAITASGKSTSGAYGSDGSLQPAGIRAGLDLLDGDELRAETILMNAKMFNRIAVVGSNNTTFGDGTVLDKVTVEGYTFPTLFGRRLVVTNKTSLVADNDMYIFAAPEFLGQFCIMKDATFDIEKKWNVISFRAYETIGIGIGNIKAAAKVTFA